MAVLQVSSSGWPCGLWVLLDSRYGSNHSHFGSLQFGSVYEAVVRPKRCRAAVADLLRPRRRGQLVRGHRGHKNRQSP